MIRTIKRAQTGPPSFLNRNHDRAHNYTIPPRRLRRLAPDHPGQPHRPPTAPDGKAADRKTGISAQVWKAQGRDMAEEGRGFKTILMLIGIIATIGLSFVVSKWGEKTKKG